MRSSLSASDTSLNSPPPATPSANAEIALCLDSRKSPTDLPARSPPTNLRARRHPHRSSLLPAPTDSACAATTAGARSHQTGRRDAGGKSGRSRPQITAPAGRWLLELLLSFEL